MKVWLQEMTWDEVEERIKDVGVALIPVGSTEQHGLHLPLGTDTYTAISVCEEAATRTGAVVAPPLWFGWSPHHTWLAGTITLRPETLVDVVVDICSSLSAHGFNGLIIVNGHRIANLPPLQQAAWRAASESKAKIILTDLVYLALSVCRELELSEIGHADEFETSHMLYVRRELVKSDKMIKAVHKRDKFRTVDPRVVEDKVVWFPAKPPTGSDAELMKGTTYGVSGDPTGATGEKGRRIHEAIVNNLVKLVEEVKQSSKQGD